MRTLLWTLVALLALVWTGGAWLGAQVLDWAGTWLAAGAPPGAADVIVQWRIPTWLVAWMDLAWLAAAHAALVAALDTLQGGWPGLAGALGWLLATWWVLWALGLAALLALAALLHRLLAPAQPAPAPGAA